MFDENPKTPEFFAGILTTWMDSPQTRSSLAVARNAFDELATILRNNKGLRQSYAPYLLNVFLVTGKLSDYSALQKYVRDTKQYELMGEIDEVIRFELPDVWIINTLKQKNLEDAISCWFLNQKHPRIRHASEAMIKALPERVDILVSARLRQTDYQISRATRSRYRRACRILAGLKEELANLEATGAWPQAMDEILANYGHRPALMDEFRKAQISG
jgi:hypothetical protein